MPNIKLYNDYVTQNITIRDLLSHRAGYKTFSGDLLWMATKYNRQEIIDRLENGEKLFIILDEILRGTNSKDKQKGSNALLRQFVRLGASGLIATHDLALGELAKDFPENVINKRFEVEIENDRLQFDYLLKEGVAKNLNATFLMKKMGITI